MSSIETVTDVSASVEDVRSRKYEWAVSMKPSRRVAKFVSEENINVATLRSALRYYGKKMGRKYMVRRACVNGARGALVWRLK